MKILSFDDACKSMEIPVNELWFQAFWQTVRQNEDNNTSGRKCVQELLLSRQTNTNFTFPFNDKYTSHSPSLSLSVFMMNGFI